MRKLNVTDRHTDRRTDRGLAISPIPGPTAPAGDKNNTEVKISKVYAMVIIAYIYTS